MFERNKKDEQAGGLDSAASAPRYAAGPSVAGPSGETAVIGRSIRINGDLRGEEDLRIEGDVNGTIQLLNNSLTIGKEGKIRADVYANSVVIDGLMEGDVYGAERVIIRKNAQVLGNITAPRVALEEGAKFKGSIEMDSQAVEAALAKHRGDAKRALPPKAAPAAAPRPEALAAAPAAKRESVNS
jgi:cytoskeletal protein CcmA (bactofilin family)